MPDETALAYVVDLVWEGNRGTGTSDYAAYERRFRVVVEGKADLLGSADPGFRGDAALHNPEEWLLAAVASCHMLTYLALCARNGVTVVRYRDEARGSLSLLPAGAGAFAGVALRPRVVVALGSDLAAAASLHQRAHQACFIARSCRFPITCDAGIECEEAAGESGPPEGGGR